jgi:hypothetical protein
MKMSSFLRYVYITEGCVINEEMLVVFSHLTRQLGLDRKKKILSKVEEDGVNEKSQGCSHPTFSRVSKFTTLTHRSIICRCGYILVYQQFCILFLILLPDGLFSQVV